MDTKWEYHGKRISLCYLMTEPSQWQHVQTGENPADLCTRGATPDELLENSLWWHGPRWLLSEDKAAWPRMNVRSCPASLPELKTSDRKEGEDVAHVLTCRQQTFISTFTPVSAAKIIYHMVASSAYHPHRRGIFLLYLSPLNLAEGVI